ncbi:heme exporter protein CcmD [Neptunomonas antarctica]|uniref:Heme exporter protein D n=1 Tax=Neptunomonas antarctica TaxID=619304 RepID=A0A1N7JCW0_9GAMM|nr:heme exporter protein CcmD [Neptunomonas antarctica]SIS47140.1 heme exporter protein D [Neptunomonas antarctica]
MQFETISEFIDMNGHGLYVWVSYGLGIAIIIGNIVLPLFTRKELIKNLARRMRRENKTQ